MITRLWNFIVEVLGVSCSLNRKLAIKVILVIHVERLAVCVFTHEIAAAKPISQLLR
ncbi:hypothetical protein [Candidatus Pseudomonas adelgestsugas]